MADTEYACRWTDWDYDAGEGETRVRYDRTGAGEEGLAAANATAWQTKAWQPRQGLPADATVVSRPLGDWTPVEDAQEASDAR